MDSKLDEVEAYQRLREERVQAALALLARYEAIGYDQRRAEFSIAALEQLELWRQFWTDYHSKSRWVRFKAAVRAIWV